MGEFNENNYILEYNEKIKSGEVTASKWVKLIYEYLTNGLEKGLFFYCSEKADDAINWIENNCFHIEGALAPGKIKLELWQKALLSSIYGIVNADGKRQFREIVLIVARKNGKTLLATAIARYEWLRGGGYGTKVFCVAPKLEQANIIYGNAWLMTTLDKKYQRLKKKIEATAGPHSRKIDDSELPKHRTSDLYLASKNSSIQKIAFSAKKSDGFNPSLCICDEVASWEGDKGLKVYEVMKSAMGAREEPIMLSCSTSGYVNDSIFDELIKRATRFLMGESGETKLLPFLYMIDDVEKWDSIEELKKSNPNLNVSVSAEYLKEEIAIANTSLSKKAEFLTKYANIKQNSSLAWLPANVVERATCEPLHFEDFEGCYCVGGIDLSQTTDLTACCVVIEKNGKLSVFEKFFIPNEKIEEATARDGLPYQIYIERGLISPSGENYVDYRDCYQWFVDLIEKYKIYPLKVGYDRYSAQYLIQDLNTYGFQTDDVFQGDNLYPIILETQGLLEDGSLLIGDNDLLKVHLLDTALKMSIERGRGKIAKVRPMAHIDGTAALLDALCVRQKHFNEIGGQLKNGG